MKVLVVFLSLHIFVPILMIIIPVQASGPGELLLESDESTPRRTRASSLDGYTYPSPEVPFPTPTTTTPTAIIKTTPKTTTKRPKICLEYLPPHQECGPETIIKIMPNYLNKTIEIPHFIPKEIPSYKFEAKAVPFPNFEVVDVQEEEAEYLPVREWENCTVKFETNEIVVRAPKDEVQMVTQDKYVLVSGDAVYSDSIVYDNGTAVETVVEEVKDEDYVIEVRPVQEMEEEIRIPVHYVVYNDTEVKVLELVTEYFDVTIHKINYTKNSVVVRSVTIDYKDYDQIEYELKVLDPVEIDYVENVVQEVVIHTVDIIPESIPVKKLNWTNVEIEVPIFEQNTVYNVPNFKMYDVMIPEFIPNPVFLPSYKKKACTVSKINDGYLPPDCQCMQCRACAICPPSSDEYEESYGEHGHGHGHERGYDYQSPRLQPPVYDYSIIR